MQRGEILLLLRPKRVNFAPGGKGREGGNELALFYPGITASLGGNGWGKEGQDK